MTADARDIDAWERCIEIERRRSPAHAERINEALAKEGLERAGRAAAYACQYAALRLRPWEWTPSWIAPSQIDAIIARGPNNLAPQEGDYAAAVLLRKMLAAGISRWEPDPIAALRAAAKKPAA
jgi:hypothetical protein